MKPWSTLLTFRLPMRRILFVIVRMCRTQFKYNHLKNRKCFLNVFAAFLNFTSNFKHFEKKKILRAFVFPKLQTEKHVIRPMSKKRFSRAPFESQHVKGSKTFVKSAWQIYRFFHHSSRNWLVKCLSDWCVKRCGTLLTDWFLVAII